MSHGAPPSPARDPRLQLEPPSPRAFIVLAVLVVGLPLLGEIVGGPIGHNLPVGGVAGRLLGAAVMLAVAGAAYAVLALAMRRHRIALDAGGIEVATSFYRRRLAWDELRLDAARVVSLDERPELRPAMKSNGMAVFGMRSGWFRTRRFGRLFVATTGGKRLLWLPTTKGYDLLLQPRQPAALLDAIKALAAAAPGMAPGRDGR